MCKVSLLQSFSLCAIFPHVVSDVDVVCAGDPHVHPSSGMTLDTPAKAQLISKSSATMAASRQPSLQEQPSMEWGSVGMAQSRAPQQFQASAQPKGAACSKPVPQSAVQQPQQAATTSWRPGNAQTLKPQSQQAPAAPKVAQMRRQQTSQAVKPAGASVTAPPYSMVSCPGAASAVTSKPAINTHAPYGRLIDTAVHNSAMRAAAAGAKPTTAGHGKPSQLAKLAPATNGGQACPPPGAARMQQVQQPHQQSAAASSVPSQGNGKLGQRDTMVPKGQTKRTLQHPFEQAPAPQQHGARAPKQRRLLAQRVITASAVSAAAAQGSAAPASSSAQPAANSSAPPSSLPAKDPQACHAQALEAFRGFSGLSNDGGTFDSWEASGGRPTQEAGELGQLGSRRGSEGPGQHSTHAPDVSQGFGSFFDLVATCDGFAEPSPAAGPLPAGASMQHAELPGQASLGAPSVPGQPAHKATSAAGTARAPDQAAPNSDASHEASNRKYPVESKPSGNASAGPESHIAQPKAQQAASAEMPNGQTSHAGASLSSLGLFRPGATCSGFDTSFSPALFGRKQDPEEHGQPASSMSEAIAGSLPACAAVAAARQISEQPAGIATLEGQPQPSSSPAACPSSDPSGNGVSSSKPPVEPGQPESSSQGQFDASTVPAAAVPAAAAPSTAQVCSGEAQKAQAEVDRGHICGEALFGEHAASKGAQAPAETTGSQEKQPLSFAGLLGKLCKRKAPSRLGKKPAGDARKRLHAPACNTLGMAWLDVP